MMIVKPRPLPVAFLALAAVLIAALAPLTPTGAVAQSVAELAKQVDVVRGITYATYEEDGKKRSVKLNVYTPKDREAGKALPAIVVIHGGAWMIGNRDTCRAHATALAANGYVAASIDYRKRPEVGITECVQDAKAAVRWVRANAATHGIDPERIGAIGGSAGGHMAAMLAVSTDPKLEGKGGNAETSSQVQAVVAMAAPASLEPIAKRFGLKEETAKLLSPMQHVDETDAPILLLHCPFDPLVPIVSSNGFFDRSKKAGADIRFEKVWTGGHPFWHTKKGYKVAMDKALRYFDVKLAEEK